MTIEIANATGGNVQVALYKRPSRWPVEPAVAWAVVSPPPRGRAILAIPGVYRVFARYSYSPEDPWQPVYQTNALQLRRNNGSLVIREVSLGRSAWGAILARDNRVSTLGDLRIQNCFAVAVWCHVQLDTHDIHLPYLLPPRCALTESLASPFFLSVVDPLTRAGAPLGEHEIRAPAIELAAGEGGVFTIAGTATRGYRIHRGAPLAEERQPKVQVDAKVDSKRRGTPKKQAKQPSRRRQPSEKAAKKSAKPGQKDT
jgi:hypothetical protein